MTKFAFRNLMLTTSALCACTVVGAVPALAQQAAEPAVQASGSADEDGTITVTGTRLKSNGNEAPTPLTVLTGEKLLETTPSTVTEALNRLPQFASSAPSRNLGFGNENASGAYLNLRQFGSNRNLVLLDGSRLPPTAANGAVDINILPLTLLKRVEVVTGGASAVYGSDAITGVVNFVLDKDFKGLKGSMQGGITKYGDNENVKFSLAGGMDVLGGRGHLLASFEHFNSKGVDRAGYLKRPGYDQFYTQVGLGTAAAPFQRIPQGRFPFVGDAAVIVGMTPNFVPALFDTYFPTDGVPSPFIHGTPFGSYESGGSGLYNNITALTAPLKTNGAFLRFDYDVSDNVKFFAQGSYNDSYTSYPYAPIYFFPGAVFTGNPFIPSSVQSIMTANNVDQIIFTTLYNKARPTQETQALVKSVYLKTGLEGSLADNSVKWSLNYGYARNSQRVVSTYNVNRNKLAAALDAVIDPASGRVVCQVSLTASASLYPGCEPLNPFGPTAITPTAIRFITDDTSFKRVNTMHDINLVLSGSPFSVWAGPVQVAVNAEYRHLSLDNKSSVEPTQLVDCTGLRPSVNCFATTALYNNNISATVAATQSVKEVGGEMLIPLLKDSSIARSFELSLAGRYTDYSTSGGVTSWKVGGSWEITDDLRVRGTLSRDIRAPTLQDLFAPETKSQVAINDLHTGLIANGIQQVERGNPSLKPEIARTNTFGLVFAPRSIPRFSVAIDYYEITIKNAITPSGPGLEFQRECEISNGTSPYCAALVRPLPFSDRTAANLPTMAISQLVNAATQSTRGVDAEVNYGFALGSGDIGLRALVSYQPSLKTQVLSSSPATNAAGIAGAVGIAGFSKWRVNLGVNYTSDGLNVAITERWMSKQQPTDRTVNVDLRPDVPAYAYTDVYLSYKINVGSAEFTPFVTIENLFDKDPPLTGANGVPGLSPVTPPSYDVFGRTFTAGVKFKF